MRREFTPLRLLSFGLVFATFIGLAGCFDDSPVPVGPRPDGKLDRRFVGNWMMETRDENGQVQTSRLVIRNLHDREYYVEWQMGSDEPFRATGWLTPVGGAQFASLMALSPEGDVDDEYLILRIDTRGAGFTLRNLSSGFFKGKALNSPDDLRAIIEANLNDEQMYDGEPLEVKREQM